jgi:hypothetical protein
MYESEHKKSGKQTTICIISGDDRSTQQRENGCGKDELTHILGAPVNLGILDSLAASVSYPKIETC